jgi:membrane protease YdiL (CAAX protease family)
MQDQPPAAEAAPFQPAPIVSLRGYNAVTLPLLALAAQFAVGLALGVILSAFGPGYGSNLSALMLIVALSGPCYLLIVHIVLKRNGWRWADLGLAQSANGPVIAAVVIGLGTSLLGAWFTVFIQGGSDAMFARATPLQLLFAFIAVGLIAPFCEEVLFRGVVYPVLRARLGSTAGAILISALIFGVFHIYPAQILTGIVLGLLFASLRQWSGGLLAPIALHTVHNVGVVALTAWRVV